MKSSTITSILAVVLSCGLLTQATIPISLSHGLIQSGIGLGAQIGGGIATLGAAALVAAKWKAEKEQPVIYRQPVVSKSVPVQLTAVTPLKHSELTSGLDLSSLTSGLGGLGGGLTLSLSKSLGRRRRSAEDYYILYQ